MSFQQGLSGLNASSKALDTIGNNVANSGTVGFKSAITEFADVYAASLSGAGTAPVGLGAKVAGIAQQFTQGNVEVTNNPLDIAINGGGFYRLQTAAGDTVYSRNGQFQLDKDGYIVSANGQKLTGYDVSGVLGPLQLFSTTSSSDALPNATGAGGGTGVQASVNLDSRETVPVPAFSITDATSYNKSTAVTVYDSLGNSHVMSLYFRKTAANTWQLYTNLDGGAAVGPSPLTFNSSGVLTGPLGGIVVPAPSFAVTTGAVTPLTFPLNLTGSTQFGATFTVNSMSQDGYTSGKLAKFNIGPDGVILGSYTNGVSRSLGQVILASFRNPQGLQPLGNNNWAATSVSGSEMTGTPGSSGQYGPLQSSALEDSNVDLTAELVNMITQQRVYQANAQTIKTQDSILQTLVNLR
jgi:flagellar hook protein FlgE